MEFWFFIFAIVAIATIGDVAKKWMKLQSTRSTQDNSEYESRLLEMEQRIQILERIVTDSKTQLKEEIESLETADN